MQSTRQLKVPRYSVLFQNIFKNCHLVLVQFHVYSYMYVYHYICLFSDELLFIHIIHDCRSLLQLAYTVKNRQLISNEKLNNKNGNANANATKNLMIVMM